MGRIKTEENTLLGWRLRSSLNISLDGKKKTASQKLHEESHASSDKGGEPCKITKRGKGKVQDKSELVGELNIMDVEIRKKRGRVLHTEMIDNDALGGGGDG